MTIEDKLKAVIRDVPNFPKEGIIFKDIALRNGVIIRLTTRKKPKKYS